MMRTIQMTLDDTLLADVDDATREIGISRSALIREALSRYLETLRIERMERQHQEGYQRIPQSDEDFAFWETVQSWEPK